MAKLVDALCSGRSARKGVLVRIQFWAQSSAKAELFYWTYPTFREPDIPYAFLPITLQVPDTRYKREKTCDKYFRVFHKRLG